MHVANVPFMDSQLTPVFSQHPSFYVALIAKWFAQIYSVVANLIENPPGSGHTWSVAWAGLSCAACLAMAEAAAVAPLRCAPGCLSHFLINVCHC